MAQLSPGSARAKGIPFTLAYTTASARGLDELAVKHVAAWRHCPLCGGDPKRAVGNKVSGEVIRVPRGMGGCRDALMGASRSSSLHIGRIGEEMKHAFHFGEIVVSVADD